MEKEKKIIEGTKKDDPDWIKGISSYYFKYKRNFDEYNRILRELYLSYIRDGKKSEEAFEKAKTILDYFDYEV